MTFKKLINIFLSLSLTVIGVFFAFAITSCGKAGTASPQGLNIEYQVLNLSPDLGGIDLYVNFDPVTGSTSPYIFGTPQGYFYVPSTDTPYQFRPYLINSTTGATTIFSRDDILASGAKYSLFVTGSLTNGTLKQIFTVDTATTPSTGRGKIRFVDASPSATGGLDVYANGTIAFSKIVYPNYSGFIEVPNGNYDFQITPTGQTTILKDLPGVTIQDGRLYTIYAYGYTSRIDTAAFNGGVLTNK